MRATIDALIRATAPAIERRARIFPMAAISLVGRVEGNAAVVAARSPRLGLLTPSTGVKTSRYRFGRVPHRATMAIFGCLRRFALLDR